MSRREILDRLYDIYNRAEFEDLSLVPEDFVFHPVQQGLHPEAIAGRDAFRKYLQPDLFVRQWVEVQEVREQGDFVLVAMRGGGETASGATLDQATFQVWRFEGDVPREAWIYTDRADAEREAGLSD